MEIYGNNTVRELPDERRRRNGRWQTVKRWQGTEDAIRAFVPQATSNPLDEVDITATGEGIEFTLSVTAASALDGSDPNSSENTTITWRTPNATESRALINHAKFTAIASNDDRDLIRGFYNHDFKNPPVFTPGTDEQKFVDAIAKGDEQYIAPIFTLVRTVSLPSGATVGNLRDYLAKVFSRAQIVSIFGPPANILTQMPTGTEGEYLCIQSGLEQTDKGGWQVSQEWVHGYDLSFLYTRWT